MPKTEVPENETKRDRWIRLMQARGGEVVEFLRKIRNLSNTSNYEYDEAMVEMFFTNLEKQLAVTKEEFMKKLSKVKDKETT